MKSTEGIAGGVEEAVKRGGFSVCLGGDHYVGYPSCLGYTRAVTELAPKPKIGYIHIDGHLDFRDDTPVWASTTTAPTPAASPSLTSSAPPTWSGSAYRVGPTRNPSAPSTPTAASSSPPPMSSASAPRKSPDRPESAPPPAATSSTCPSISTSSIPASSPPPAP